MSIKDFFVKEKPVFTGITRGLGGFGFGKAAGGGGAVGPFSASGGNIADGITPGNGYVYHTFSTNGTFTVSGGSEAIESLIVGGGGAADFCSGGGGGGGIAHVTTVTVTSGAYAVTVGTGADNADNQPRAPQPNGGDSSIVLPVGTVTGYGGGSTGDYNPGNSYPLPSTNGAGGSGSGGGTVAPAYPPDAPYPSAWYNPNAATQPDKPTFGGVVTNYGVAGGRGGPNTGSPPNPNHLSGGGGGGAGGQGQDAGPNGPTYAGNGGVGQPFPDFAYPDCFPSPHLPGLTPHSPNNTHYGGGGGGGLHRAGGGGTGVPNTSGGLGGYGGGGQGDNGPSNPLSCPGINMLGGGAGAAGGATATSTISGGDGIVIIRYPV
jgi:hypothetical protein